MERAAHEPGLDERLALPERIPHVVYPAIDAHADLELRGRHHLGLDAADVTDDTGQVLLGRAAQQVVALEPERVDLCPRQLSFDGRPRFHIKHDLRACDQSKSLRPRVTNWSRRGPVPIKSTRTPMSSPMRST